MEASDQERPSFGDVMRQPRQDAGLSQAGFAAAAGIHLRQIHRYESGEQQPALDVAQRLATALGVTLDELAGGSSERVTLNGTWWAAWQTFNDGEQVIATQPVGLDQHGSTIDIEALEPSAENERGGYLWRVELRLGSSDPDGLLRRRRRQRPQQGHHVFRHARPGRLRA